MRCKMKDEYYDKVFRTLETFGYDELVNGFKPEDVAKSMAGTINNCYDSELSPMMASIIIWSLTMNMQIIPHAARQVKH